MQYQVIDRQDFMKRMVILTTLAGAGHLPLLGAELGNGSGIDATTGPAAVKPIRGYLPRFAPPSGEAADHAAYALTYEIIHWTGVASGTGETKNNVLGSLTIKRRDHGDEAHYQVTQQTEFGGLDNIVEAQIVCATDDLNTLQSWGVRTYSKDPSGDKVALSEMNETGENREGQILVRDGGHEYGFSASNPVLSQWTVLDFLIRHAAKTSPVTFDLLQDLSLFKADQTIAFDGTVEVTVKGGHKVKLDSYAQTGEGVLPIHYLLDEQHRPQLVTGSLVSWALQDVTSS